jgi:hypothetical protein
MPERGIAEQDHFDKLSSFTDRFQRSKCAFRAICFIQSTSGVRVKPASSRVLGFDHVQIARPAQQ